MSADGFWCLNPHSAIFFTVSTAKLLYRWLVLTIRTAYALVGSPFQHPLIGFPNVIRESRMVSPSRSTSTQHLVDPCDLVLVGSGRTELTQRKPEESIPFHLVASIRKVVSDSSARCVQHLSDRFSIQIRTPKVSGLSSQRLHLHSTFGLPQS